MTQQREQLKENIKQLLSECFDVAIFNDDWITIDGMADPEKFWPKLLDLFSSELSKKDEWWREKIKVARGKFHDIQTTTDKGYENLISGLHELDALSKEGGTQ